LTARLDIFDRIDILPHLKKLTVIMLRLRDIHRLPLKRLLHDHAATLRHVSLKLDIAGRRSSTYDDHPLLSFMTDLLLDNQLFVNLESFEFMPVTSSSFQIITMYLARSADTLTSLTLLDGYLTYEDITTLTSVFFQKNASLNLQTLVLNVQFFGPQLLALLATSFPRLKCLELYAFDWGIENITLAHLSMRGRLVRISCDIVSNCPSLMSVFRGYSEPV
jgi:hypothetical protein